MSKIVDIADSIVTALNAATFVYSDSPINIEKRWLPYMERQEVGDGPAASDRIAQVVVVPNNQVVVERLTRTSSKHEIQVDVFVQRASDWSISTDVDATVNFAEEVFVVADAIALLTTEGINANQLFSNYEPFIAGDHLLEYKIFTSRITTRWSLVIPK